MRKVLVPAIMLVTACSRAVSVGTDRSSSAVANITDPNGAVVATATFAQTADGVSIDVNATKLPGGIHGVHLHATGDCASANSYAAAGSHFNPAGKEHGIANPRGPHAGDLPNIEISGNGSGTMHTVNNRVTLNELFDADGTSILIHAGKDDNVSQPSGNSGAKIACGVITRK